MPLHIRPQGLGDAIQAVKALGFRGVNVTIPHKVEVMKHLDVVDEGAQRIGAVNTIVNDNGKLTGYNTDGIGYVRSLKDEACPDLKESASLSSVRAVPQGALSMPFSAKGLIRYPL